MKIALLGKGKTGSKVIELCEHRNDIELNIFDSKNQPTLTKLKENDIILSFLTGEIFLKYIEMISDSGIPVVCGSTGFEWNEARIGLVEKSKVPWIHATNFSLGMSIVKEMIKILSKAPTLLNDSKFKINEIHHTKKLDAPSGTAISWKKWLNQDCEVTSERVGDIIGVHELSMSAQTEEILLRHEAKDRKIFANGALWACETILQLKPGLHEFSNITFNALMEK